MKISRVSQSRSTTRLIPVTAEDKRVTALADFDAKPDQVTVRYEGDTTFVYAGLGKSAQCTPGAVRSAVACAVRRAMDLKRTFVALEVPGLDDKTGAWDTACVEGLVLGSYTFDRYKTRPSEPIKKCELVGASATARTLARVQTVAESTNMARDLVNENADEITPEGLARHARDLSRLGPVRVRVLDEEDLEREKMDLILAVGRGSPTPPRLVAAEYGRANAKNKPRVAIVGKGITFDSGGVNLKKVGSVETMRNDMAGAAAVLGLMRAVALLAPAANVVGVVAAAHNALDGASYFPGDVYRSLSGKTVEITNTDAEGRLVLADAVTWCERQFKPDILIDIATLTGGVVIALGETVAGLFSDDDDLAQSLFEAGERTNERLWRLPIYPEHRQALKGDRADLRNTARFKRGYASSITGAAFISEFVTTSPWAHLDIAGTAYNEGKVRGEVCRMGTGYGVRLLARYLDII